MTSKEKIIEQLKTVEDPELGIDIYTVGLIYEINIESDDHVHIVMTFTTPLCPVGPTITSQVEKAIRDIGYSYVEIEVTFDPPWQPPDDLKEIMGIVL